MGSITTENRSLTSLDTPKLCVNITGGVQNPFPHQNSHKQCHQGHLNKKKVIFGDFCQFSPFSAIFVTDTPPERMWENKTVLNGETPHITFAKTMSEDHPDHVFGSSVPNPAFFQLTNWSNVENPSEGPKFLKKHVKTHIFGNFSSLDPIKESLFHFQDTKTEFLHHPLYPTGQFDQIISQKLPLFHEEKHFRTFIAKNSVNSEKFHVKIWRNVNIRLRSMFSITGQSNNVPQLNKRVNQGSFTPQSCILSVFWHFLGYFSSNRATPDITPGQHVFWPQKHPKFTFLSQFGILLIPSVVCSFLSVFLGYLGFQFGKSLAFSQKKRPFPSPLVALRYKRTLRKTLTTRKMVAKKVAAKRLRKKGQFWNKIYSRSLPRKILR